MALAAKGRSVRWGSGFQPPAVGIGSPFGSAAPWLPPAGPAAVTLGRTDMDHCGLFVFIFIYVYIYMYILYIYTIYILYYIYILYFIYIYI